MADWGAGMVGLVEMGVTVAVMEEALGGLEGAARMEHILCRPQTTRI